MRRWGYWLNVEGLYFSNGSHCLSISAGFEFCEQLDHALSCAKQVLPIAVALLYWMRSDTQLFPFHAHRHSRAMTSMTYV